MPKHKKFIESQKNAVTYRVINREMGASQYDDNAPKTIWVPKSENTEPILPLPHLPVSKPNANDERLYPSKGPRPDWDCDVVAALDDDFDYDDPSNILDDDFIAKADALSLAGTENSKGDKATEEEGSEFSDDSDFHFSDCESLDSQNLCQRKQTSKKAVSQYSMTSAVTNCTESVKTFNEHFEKIMEAYGEDEIGALDFDNIEGCLTDGNPILDDLYKEKEAEELTLGKYDDRFKKFVLTYAEVEPKEKIVEIVTEGKIEFDCESILSTNSNLFNHPAVIKANYKKTSFKTSGKSLDVNLELDEISEDEDSDDDDEVLERCSAICSTRPRDETAEERRERKKLLKTAKREQRVLKKENKVAFKNAKKKMSKREINLQHNAGVKLL